MKLNVGLSVLVAMMALATACGGSDEAPRKSANEREEEVSVRNKASKQCRALIEAGCDFWIECGVVDEDERGECIEDAQDELDCDEAVSVTSDYADCMDDLEDTSWCSDEFEFPASCDEVVRFR